MSAQSQAADPLVEVVFVDDAHAVGLWGPLVIQISRGAPTGPFSATVNDITARFIEASPRPISFLFVIERDSPKPDEACLKNLVVFGRDLVRRMNVAILLSEGSFFRGAIVRAVCIPFTAVWPHASKFKFANDLDTAAKLLQPFIRPYTGEQLEAAVEYLRARIV